MKRLLLCLALSACSAGTNAPTTISAVISGIQADLTKAGVVSVSHVEGWSAAQMSAFDANVRALQCGQKTADPVVAMIAGPVTMNLTGSFTQSGSFSVSTSLTSPVFGLQADASRTHGQSLSLPVQFVPLTALPDAEMGRAIGYAGDLIKQRPDVTDRIVSDQDALAAHIRLLTSGYDGNTCSAVTHPFVGTRHAS
ncbi:hypothetical protein [Gluconobacter thailandicus]|uniref:Uncharacterized protein n=1 Tax=Gluconobacter thailandicus TaxID=257438 RepID=A0AAP9EU98_GLUTH|nr:hypothetical protein [Gluconobacter thailandicus]QEH97259.1 hypothetical protein FXF46_14140 [Gluconobacter thailandicus]